MGSANQVPVTVPATTQEPEMRSGSRKLSISARRRLMISSV
jgi:hypothetical protein